MVVFSRQIYKHAKRYLLWLGIPNIFLPRKREVVIFPPILHSKFNSALSTEDSLLLRERYGFSRHKRLILITGGGAGLPGGENLSEGNSRSGAGS